MKKPCLALSVCLLLGMLCGCGAASGAPAAGPESETISEASGNIPANTPEKDEASQTQTPLSSAGSGAEPVDLTALSSTMVYAEVYNMLVTPEDYVGRTVKMQGQFAVYEDTENDAVYYACVIADATACCQQGLEFVLSQDLKYPDDYPELGSEIVVTGTFELYEENGYQYCHLVNSEMTE